MRGLALETATSRIEVAVCEADGRVVEAESLEAGYGHTRELMPLVKRVMEATGTAPDQLSWVAADLGPGSFTGVRVGLASAHALALAGGARVRGASSLASLAHSTATPRALLVPLVPAGKRELYAGFFRTEGRGQVRLLAAPRVLTLPELIPAVEECRRVVPRNLVHFVGPGVTRALEALEAAWPGSTQPPWRHEGLSAADLAASALSRDGPAAGLPAPEQPPDPLYVRGAQAEERVRRQATARDHPLLRAMALSDLDAVVEIEKRVFGDPWPPSFFRGELRQPMVYARVAELEGALAGYLVAWLGAGTGHLGNLAVAPAYRRRGIARRLLEDLFARARQLAATHLTLEVRVSNFAAQRLYREYGFRLAGLRRGYYRDTGEDAIILEWRARA